MDPRHATSEQAPQSAPSHVFMKAAPFTSGDVISYIPGAAPVIIRAKSEERARRKLRAQSKLMDQWLLVEVDGIPCHDEWNIWQLQPPQRERVLAERERVAQKQTRAERVRTERLQAEHDKSVRDRLLAHEAEARQRGVSAASLALDL